MKVTLIALTTVVPTNTADILSLALDQDDSKTDSGWHSADYLGEFAGRSCYESWNRPNSETATNRGYIENIIKQNHFSVLEHASATFYIEGVSRSLTHELVRHRHLSFSQRSQRYVDESDATMIYPEALRTDDDRFQWELDAAVGMSKVAYRRAFQALVEQGFTRKKARQAARSILPNMTATSIVVTGNHRAWRDVLAKRWHVAADVEICELAGKLLEELRKIAPNTYQDIPTQPYGSPSNKMIPSDVWFDSDADGLRDYVRKEWPQLADTLDEMRK